MRGIIIRLTLLCFVAFLAAGVSAQEKKDEVQKVPRPGPPLNFEIQGSRVAIPEDILYKFVDEPNHHFGEARESFLKKDYVKSAAEMRKGADFVKLEMARSSGEGQKALAGAVMRLEKLAGDIESGLVTSVDGLNTEFAHAEQALAYHHELKAEEYWQANDNKGTGQDLKAASINLKNSLKYTGEKIEAETEGAIKDAGEIGEKLFEGAPLANERVNASLDALSDKIDEAGTKLEQPKK